MTQTFLFYDLETSGLNAAFDQVMQYAGIRTDAQGNVLEQDSFWVQLVDDVIPNPQALLVHKQGITQCNAQGIAYDQGIKRIHVALNHPGTCSGGYNTLGFDDEFLRFSFYRYLLTPYTHQYAQGCSRFDLYPIVVLYALFNPNVLEWPMRNGKRSFKLEDLNTANQLAPEAVAHHALGDVEVTIALAKRLQAYPQMWHYALGYFDKHIDQQRQAKLPKSFEQYQLDRPLALWVEGSLGEQAQYQAPVMYLGQHRHYKNQSLWLRLDQEALCTTQPEHFIETVRVMRKKAGEPGFLLPLIPRYTTHWSMTRRAQVEAGLAFCQTHSTLIETLVNHHAQMTYPPLNCDADAALYQGFRSDRETQQAERFWQSTPTQRLSLVRQWSGLLKEQGLRFLWRHAPNVFEQTEQAWLQNWLSSLSDVVVDHRNQPRRRIKQVQEEMQALQKDTKNQEDAALLDALQQWCVDKKTRIEDELNVLERT